MPPVLLVMLIPVANSVNDTGGKLAPGVNDTGGNLPPVTTTTAVKFATGDNNTHGYLVFLLSSLYYTDIRAELLLVVSE